MPRKINPDVNPVGKLLALYSTLLFAKRPISLSELADGVHCSKQTILRHIAELEKGALGNVICLRRGKENYYSLDRPKDSKRVSINAEGLSQLILCRDFLLHLLPEAMRSSMDVALRQAIAFVSEEESEVCVGQIGESLTKGRIDYTPFQGMLQSLTRAILQHRVCDVKYSPRRESPIKSYSFAPIRLVAYHEALYVMGWVVTDRGVVEALYEKLTPLAVHRLKEVAATRRDASSLPDKLEENKEDFGFLSSKSFGVKIKFSPRAAAYVEERQWSRVQGISRNKDGSIVLSMQARSQEEVISWVLSFGKEAEILSPDSLRGSIAEQVSEIGRIYDDNGAAGGPLSE